MVTFQKTTPFYNVQNFQSPQGSNLILGKIIGLSPQELIPPKFRQFCSIWELHHDIEGMVREVDIDVMEVDFGGVVEHVHLNQGMFHGSLWCDFREILPFLTPSILSRH